MKKILFLTISVLLLTITTLNSAIPDTISVFNDENIHEALNEYPYIYTSKTTSQIATAKLFGIIPVKKLKYETYPRLMLSPGGNAFGIKFFTDGILVIGLSDVKTINGSVSPGKVAGIQAGDVIKECNGKKIENSDEFVKQIELNGSAEKKLLVSREGNDFEVVIKPALSQDTNSYKVGLWVRDSTAGIGTVTFIDSETNIFAGLGHGICDTDTGILMPLGSAAIVNVSIEGITKGKVNDPGELRGLFSNIQKGFLTANTNVGVFGLYDSLPTKTLPAIPIGLKGEVEVGEATIFCTLNKEEPKEYKIEIIKINKMDSDTKNILIKVIDERLLAETGGIVQGMSGSPIVQKGKLIGAVTHVLINDPTKGYGIFIENMLEKLN